MASSWTKLLVAWDGGVTTLQHILVPVITTPSNRILLEEQTGQVPSVTKEISYILWNLRVCYCIHFSSTLVLILCHISIVHTLPSHFFKIHINIILPATSTFSKWFFPLIASASCYLLHLTSKYFSQPPVLECPQSAFYFNVTNQVSHPTHNK